MVPAQWITINFVYCRYRAITAYGTVPCFKKILLKKNKILTSCLGQCDV